VKFSALGFFLVRRLADECCKYGAENQKENNYVARAVLQFGASHNFMENEKETLVGVLNDQVILFTDSNNSKANLLNGGDECRNA
jgi:endophilin-A